MDATTPPALVRVRCANCGKLGLHANGPTCLTCGAYLPPPGAEDAALPHAGANSYYASPAASFVQPRRTPRWVVLLINLAIVVILRVVSAVVLYPRMVSTSSKLVAVIDLCVVLVADGLLLITLILAVVWGIAWLVKAVRRR